MILCDREIWMEIQTGRLTFVPPIEPDQVSPSAVDLRLSDQFTVLESPPAGAVILIDPSRLGDVEAVARRFGETTTIEQDATFELRPGQFVLAYTLERIELPNYLAARIEGRSTLARLGISIHQTAPTVHATFQGQLRLEISNDGPFTVALRPNQRVCQLIIERLGTPSQGTLRSAWQQQRQP